MTLYLMFGITDSAGCVFRVNLFLYTSVKVQFLYQYGNQVPSVARTCVEVSRLITSVVVLRKIQHLEILRFCSLWNVSLVFTLAKSCIFNELHLPFSSSYFLDGAAITSNASCANFTQYGIYNKTSTSFYRKSNAEFQHRCFCCAPTFCLRSLLFEQ